MKLSKLCRNTLIPFLSALALISSLLVQPGICQDAEDSQVFISGFNAYQQKDYATTIKKMNEVLKKYPDTPLRDMTLFWLARAYYKSGNQQDAARYMSQFTKEFPDNPLKGTVEEELLALAAQQEKSEKSSAAASTKQAEKQAEAQKAVVVKKQLAKEQAENQRQAALQKEQQRLATIKAEEERAASAKAAELKLAAEQAELQRLAAIKAEEERVNTVKLEQVRLQAQKVEQERAAVVAAEAAKQADLQKEQMRLAAAKAEQERGAAEQVAQQKLAEEQKKLAAIKAEEERVNAEKAELVRLHAQKAEKERAAVVAAEAAKQVELQKEQMRLAAVKAEDERLAQEAANMQRQAELDAELARLAAAKASEEKVLAEKAEQTRVAAIAAEAEKRAALQREQERLAAAKLAEEKAASEKAAQLKLEAEKAEQQRAVALKAEQERVRVAKAENDRLAAEKALALQRQNEERIRAEKIALKDQAIAQYKSVIEKYPNTRAASAAAVKLKELGVAVPAAMVAATVEQPENAQVLKVEVAQFGSFDFNLIAAPKTYDVAHRITLPFEVTNRGNGNDSFYLESGFPAEYGSGFAEQGASDKAINQTPSLAPGETFKGLVTLSIPAGAIDGLRITHPVKVASRFMGEATQSREISLIAASPLIRSVIKSDKTELLPGEKISYRIAVLNVGSTTARNVSIRLNFPPQLEPLDYAAAGFKQEMKAALVMDGQEIKSGENREFTVAFQLKDDSLAGQELIARAELINNPLNTTATFVSNVARVKPMHGIKIGAGPGRLVVIPGQTITVPIVVTNTGNIRDKFNISTSFKGAAEATIFLDMNRDGIRQPTEAVISSIGPLEPKEEVGVAIEIKTTRNSADGSEGGVQIVLVSEANPAQTVSASASIVYSRPVLQMSVVGRDSRLKPGEIATFELNVVNRGSNLARTVELQSNWPAQLELIASEPANSVGNASGFKWKFKELGAGEKKTIRVSFRVKAGIGVGTSMQVKNIMTYEDQLGNRY